MLTSQKSNSCQHLPLPKHSLRNQVATPVKIQPTQPLGATCLSLFPLAEILAINKPCEEKRTGGMVPAILHNGKNLCLDDIIL